MSDFAGKSLEDENGNDDLSWIDTVDEHFKFMRFFGISSMPDAEIRAYEIELMRRNIEPVLEHKL